MAIRVHVNCAMSLDGCIGLSGPRPLKISGREDMRRVHELRAASDAILVGVGTVVADDPKLTVKWDLLGRSGKNPLRIVLDAALRTPHGAHVLDAAAPSLVYHGRKGGALPGHAQLAVVDVDSHGFLDLRQVLEDLERRGVRTLMVEGGATVLSAFLGQRLVDELSVYIGPQLVGQPDAPRLYLGRPVESVGLACASTARLGEGVLVRWLRS